MMFPDPFGIDPAYDFWDEGDEAGMYEEDDWTGNV